MAKLFITDHGDPSVGIFSKTFTVETPFDKSDEPEDLQFFLDSQIEIYSEYASGQVTGEYDYERQAIIEAEIATYNA